MYEQLSISFYKNYMTYMAATGARGRKENSKDRFIKRKVVVEKCLIRTSILFTRRRYIDILMDDGSATSTQDG